jgi:hypothetical protein
MNEIKKIGNITFTDTCAFVEREYDEKAADKFYEETMEARNKDTAQAFECAMVYLQMRIDHCRTELELNFANAKAVTVNGVYWTGGHFAVPTYEYMLDAVSNAKCWDDLNRLQLQQVVRALYLQRNANAPKYFSSVIKDLAFNIATELLLCKMDNQEDYIEE